MKQLRVTDLYCLYLNHVRATKDLSPRRLKAAESYWRLFLDQHGQMLIETDLKGYHLTDFIEANPSWKCSGTRKYVCDVLKAPLTWAAKQGRIAVNPFGGINYEKSGPRPAMPDESLEKIVAASHWHARVALRWLRITACRVSELCRADWKDIDWVRAVWCIPLHKKVKRTRKPRYVALIPEAVELLRTLETDAIALKGKADGPIFQSSRGERWGDTGIWKQINRVKKRLGMDEKASTHGLRHQWATLAVSRGAPPKLLAEQMGDTLKTVEDYYIHLDGQTEAIRSAAMLGVPRRA